MGPNGETILDYSVKYAAQAGYGKVVLVIRRSMEADFQEYILPRYKNVIPVEYVFQELDMLPAGFSVNPERVKPYGTAHAILVAKDAIKEPFTVINADDFYGKEPFQILGDYLRDVTANDPTAFAMVGYRLDKTLSENGTVSRGVCQVDGDGYLTIVKEMRKIGRTDHGIENNEDGVVTPLTGEEPVSMNFWGFSPRFFDTLTEMFAQFLNDNEGNIKAEFPIPDAVTSVMQRGLATVRVLPTTAEWFGVTYAEDRPKVVEKLKHVE
jgi:dTDP-glucose pyrophosphorylase